MIGGPNGDVRVAPNGAPAAPSGGFPADDYTPWGYLNTPGHTRSRPLGVLRSEPGPGFAWHFPSLAGGYGGKGQVYTSSLSLDVPHAGLDCPYHTTNLMRYRLAVPGGTLHAAFHPAGENALRLVARFDAPEGSPPLPVAARAAYTRRLAAAGQWGESGLVGRPVDGGVSLQTFEDGPTFLFTADRPARAGLSRGPATPGDLPAEGFLTVLGDKGEQVELHAALSVTLAPGESVTFLLARGVNPYDAWTTQAEVTANGPALERELEAADARFWATAPRLEGDWPAHWRRGLVYDLETLRLMVKPPSGRFAHAWDAMQVHAPRVVLAETAMDVLSLSSADPALAQEVLLGTFLDAFAANVPCSREDGSLNMISADGEPCGTGPQWGFPFWAAQALYRAQPDRAWLAALTPRLDDFLAWWLDNRRDGPGPWLGFACSWESGQDDSPRFLEQPLGGGHPVRGIHPVDLHASVAHAAVVLAGFWDTLQEPAKAEAWRAVAAEHAALTERLWTGERYADRDGRQGGDGTPTGVDDPMLFTPWALGVADAAHAEAGRRRLDNLDGRGEVWPMFVWVTTEAAWTLGEHERAAELAAAVIERAYARWDAREPVPGRAQPGVASEFWPHDRPSGGEGYGWGAFTTHLLLSTLLGYRPQEDGLTLTPNLPSAWREAGRSYRARLTHHGRPVTINLEPLDAERVRLSVNDRILDAAWGAAVRLDDRDLNP